MSWLRLYTEILDDPKVQAMPAVDFKNWINLLCIAKRYNGTFPRVSSIAFHLRVSEQEAYLALTRLKEFGLIDAEDEYLVPHNWRERQYISDTSTERVRKFRFKKQQGNVSGNVTSTVSETPPETETETETEQSKDIRESNASSSAKADVGEAIRLWNETAELLKIPRVQRLTDGRKKKLALRLGDLGGLDGWLALLAKIRASPFLRGETGWSGATIDWVLEPKNLTKIMEGNYDDRPKLDKVTTQHAQHQAVIDAVFAESERRKAEARNRADREILYDSDAGSLSDDAVGHVIAFDRTGT